MITAKADTFLYFNAYFVKPEMETNGHEMKTPHTTHENVYGKNKIFFISGGKYTMFYAIVEILTTKTGVD